MKKLLLLGLVIGTLIVAGGALVYGFVFRAPVDEPVWVLASFSGDVLAAKASGEWRPVTLKMRLEGSDRLRTTSDGEATLTYRESHVTVRPATELGVAELRPGLSDFSVAEGLVFIEARGDRIRATSFAGHVADGQDAGFGLSVDKGGLAKVQVKRGEIDFRSGGHAERVREGEQSEARAGRPPSRPVKIPRNLFLTVKFPDADTFNTRLARVEGRVEPGSRALVGGVMVETDAEGRFAADVPLHEGTNQIEVEARDSLGRTRTEQSRPIRVDMEQPFLTDTSFGRHAVDARGESIR